MAAPRPAPFIKDFQEVRCARHVAWRFRGSFFRFGLNHKDAYQEIKAHLFEVSPKFDESRGASLSTFLIHCGKQFAIKILHRQRARFEGMKLWFPRAEETAGAGEDAECIRQLMAVLHPRRRLAVTMRVAGFSYRAIANRLCVTRERSRQIVSRSLFLMRVEAGRIAARAGLTAYEYWGISANGEPATIDRIVDRIAA